MQSLSLFQCVMMRKSSITFISRHIPERSVRSTLTQRTEPAENTAENTTASIWPTVLNCLLSGMSFSLSSSSSSSSIFMEPDKMAHSVSLHFSTAALVAFALFFCGLSLSLLSAFPPALAILLRLAAVSLQWAAHSVSSYQLPFPMKGLTSHKTTI